MRKKQHILKLEKDDPEKEIDFEIEYQLSLTMQQRYKKMLKLSRELSLRMRENGLGEASKIIKRS